MRSGVLLINVGTPTAPTYGAVKKYLGQFLMDKRILDISAIWRFLLVHLLITPLRARQSAKKYREIWQENGSPLYNISLRQVAVLSQHLGHQFHVAMAMRYGQPSIAKQLKYLMAKDCDQIILVPLFPHYSSAASGSALEEAFSCLKREYHIPAIKTLGPFYEEDFFLHNVANKIAPFLSPKKHLIISFHGLPYHHIKRSHKDAPCPHSQACEKQAIPPFCYRAQSFATARRIAQKLNLNQESYSVCFQSRFLRQQWIEPYLHDTLKNLRNQGIDQVVVVCPAFVADCLETLHEIGIEAKHFFQQQLGGKTFELVPCLNEDELWLKGLSEKITAHAR
jgi:ferrochelatase